MGLGLQRVAKQCGGLIVTARGESVKHVPCGSTSAMNAAIIRRNTRGGWRFDGFSEDGEFIIFSKKEAT